MAVDEDDIPTGEFEVEDEAASRLDLEDLLQLRDTVDALVAHQDFHLLKYDTFQPTSDVVISMMETGIGIAIPTPVLSFFREISDGLDVVWTYFREGHEPSHGNVQLYNFGRVFGTWVDEVWGVVPEGGDQRDLDFSWELRPIEAPHPGGTHYTVMHVPDFAPTYNLYYHDPKGSSHRLSVDFVGYFRCLLETRGFYGWQFLVSDVDFETHPVARERAEAFHRLMPKMFPDTDFSRYRNA